MYVCGGGASIKGTQYKILTEFYDILLKGRFQPPTLALRLSCIYAYHVYAHNVQQKTRQHYITPIFAAGILIWANMGPSKYYVSNNRTASLLIFGKLFYPL